ncbi:isochorismatase family cysteine hydrolase [Rugamonas sp.]|uniref:isochorismatase family cysteine hydrolase n=1 Tax=Rugamonas sp. TaxID=1926287 RepID=UPI0025EA9F66|nr:isochorismatase family cysteine hydrolase [Rugamonas sp.]
MKSWPYLSVAGALVLAFGAAAAGPAVAITAAAPATAAADGYHASSTALLIVDPYNDFMTKGGKLYDTIKPTADASAMFEHLRQIIPAARAAGIQVFVLPHHRSLPDGSDYPGWQNVNLFEQKTHGMKAFEAGTWGGEFNPEFGPKKGDIVIREHYAQNGFSNTDLDFELKQHGIRKIILVGVIANSCIEATGRYGMEMGYHVTLVSDAVAAFDEEGMRAARTNAPMFAHAIVTTSELLTKLPPP